MLSRRLFVSSLFVAPAIIKIDNLMPMKFIDIYNTRCLVDYRINTDSLVLRIDRALHELKIPKHVSTFPIETAFKIFGKSNILNIKPVEGTQKYIFKETNSIELLKYGINHA